jgi:hypothetical protein
MIQGGLNEYQKNSVAMEAIRPTHMREKKKPAQIFFPRSLLPVSPGEEMELITCRGTRESWTDGVSRNVKLF